MSKLLYSFETEQGKFGILKPTRRLREDGDLYYAQQVNFYVKAGLMPRAVYATKINDSGGLMGDSDRELYGKLILEYRDTLEKIKELEEKEEEISEEVKKEIDALNLTLERIRTDIGSYEQQQISAFDNTAESKARDKAILWWVLNLSQKVEDGNIKPFFEGDSLDDKIDYYDNIEDKTLLSISNRLISLVTLWYLGICTKESDFIEQDKSLTNG